MVNFIESTFIQLEQILEKKEKVTKTKVLQLQQKKTKSTNL